MGYLDMVERFISEKNGYAEEVSVMPSIEHIPHMKLSEFAKRSLAIEIYSEILQRKIWFCSNDEMVRQIKRDVPDAICYTADELKHLLSLKPTTGDIKKLHLLKKRFKNSKIIEAKKLKEAYEQQEPD